MSVFTSDEIRILKSLASGMLKAMGRGAPASNGAAMAGAADDSELDGKYGSPKVRKDPKRWAGASYVGAEYSRCPSDYLQELAGYLDWCANKDAMRPDPKRHRNGTPYYEYDRKNAALARGWAARNAGKTFDPPAQAEAVDDPYGHEEPAQFTEEEYPF
jgi:hypothetical protein